MGVLSFISFYRYVCVFQKGVNAEDLKSELVHKFEAVST